MVAASDPRALILVARVTSTLCQVPKAALIAMKTKAWLLLVVTARLGGLVGNKIGSLATVPGVVGGAVVVVVLVEVVELVLLVVVELEVVVVLLGVAVGTLKGVAIMAITGIG